MNIEQIKAVFDSMNVRSQYTDRHTLIALHQHGDKFTIERTFTDWDKEHPRYWEIYAMNGMATTVVTDEFELQDWVINEFNSD